MPRGEGDDLVTDGVQALQLGGKVNGSRSLGRPSLVEAGDTDRVTSSDDTVLVLVVENEGEHAIEVFRGVDAIFQVLSHINSSPAHTKLHITTYQRNDDFTIGMCLEVVRLAQGLPDNAMIVDFTIDRQGEGFVIVDNGLSTGIYHEVGLKLEKKIQTSSQSCLISSKIGWIYTHPLQQCSDAHAQELRRDRRLALRDTTEKREKQSIELTCLVGHEVSAWESRVWPSVQENNRIVADHFSR